jgi:hypothetical protein
MLSARSGGTPSSAPAALSGDDVVNLISCNHRRTLTLGRSVHLRIFQQHAMARFAQCFCGFATTACELFS